MVAAHGRGARAEAPTNHLIALATLCFTVRRSLNATLTLPSREGTHHETRPPPLLLPLNRFKPMPPRIIAVLAVLLPLAAFAQNSAITVNPGSECQGLFKSVWLSIDGQMQAAVNGGSPNRADNISPGSHEVTVNCVEGFTAKAIVSQDINFPPGTELRMRLKGRTLEMVGRSPWAPAVVAAPVQEVPQGKEGPSAAMKKEAGSFMDDAENDLKDLLKLLNDEDDRCVGKLSAKVELAREALGGSVSLGTVDDTRDRVNKSLTRAAKALQ